MHTKEFLILFRSKDSSAGNSLYIQLVALTRALKNCGMVKYEMILILLCFRFTFCTQKTRQGQSFGLGTMNCWPFGCLSSKEMNYSFRL